jgi:tetratricopeptide (TPR) repeat protein
MFNCQNPDCNISLSKASFPSQLPCPLCKGSLTEIKEKYVLKDEFTTALKEIKDLIKLIVENSKNEKKPFENIEVKIQKEDEEIISFLPYIIAYPLEKTITEEHAWTKINLLKDTLLNYLKFLGLITASEFFNSPFKDKNIIASFYKNLSHPSFGSWNAFIRETLKFLNDNNHEYFCPELNDYYNKVETGKKRKLYSGEIEIIDSMGDVQLKKQQATAIGMLINFRNRYLGHGLTLDKDTSQKLWKQYYPIFQQLLLGLEWCKDYVIYKNEGKNTWLLQGAKISQVEVLKAEENIWIQNKKGEKINLVPFFIVPGEVALTGDDTKLLTYESYTGKSIKFFSPEGLDKTTSGRTLERLNLLIRMKQEENPYPPSYFTEEIMKERIAKENQFVLQTLLEERKIIKGIYQSREDIESKLRSWVGGMSNVFFIAAEAGSGKTNLLVEIQRQYKEKEFDSLLIRACRMAKNSLKEEISYLLNIDPKEKLSAYKSLNQSQKNPLFIIIDGINESPDEQEIWNDIKEISKSFEAGVIKFVVSCRVNNKNDLDRFEIKGYEDIFFSESNEDIKQLSNAIFWLTPLNMIELEGAWNTYTTKNKKTTNPQFKFKDIADYDRSLYEKIKNPLILRIFLETYHNKPLPKKGKKKLKVWRDWFSSFKEGEKNLLKLLSKKVWEKDNNELELEELLKDEKLEPFITDNKVNAPYSRLLTLGWLSRFNKGNTIYISLTVEGLLFYLLGLFLENDLEADVKIIEEWISEKSVIKKSAIESYLIECAEKNEISLISDLIDNGEKTLEITIPALIEFAKTFGGEKTLDALFDNPTELDWLALKKLVDSLDKLELKKLNKELLIGSREINKLEIENQFILGFKTLKILNKNEQEIFFKKFNLKNDLLKNNYDLIKSLANYFHRSAQFEEALEYYKKLLKISKKQFGGKDGKTSTALNLIGNFYKHRNNNEAIKCLQKSLDIVLTLNGENHKNTASIFGDLGDVWYSKGDYDKAIDFHEKSLVIRLKLFGEQHNSTADSYGGLGLAYSNKNEHEKSIEYYEKSLVISLKVFGEQHSAVSTLYNNIGFVHKRKGEYNTCIKYFKKTLDIIIILYGSQHPVTGIIYNNIGAVYGDIKDFKNALVFCEKSLTIKLKSYAEDHPSVGKTYENLGDIYKGKKDYDKAKEYYQKAFNIFKIKMGANHERTRLIENYLKELKA